MDKLSPGHVWKAAGQTLRERDNDAGNQSEKDQEVDRESGGLIESEKTLSHRE